MTALKWKSLFSGRLIRSVVIMAVGMLVGCKSGQVAGEKQSASAVGTRPFIIYVTDFELGAADIQREAGALSGRPGPVGRVGTRLSGASGDPAVRARELVELMSSSLVKDLHKEGLSAARLLSGVSLPATGWLLRGIFTQVQEGNRLRRAVIGFGSGQTDIQVVAGVHDLSQGPPKPLYEMEADAGSGKMPGGGAVIALSPYGAAARFVMAGDDLEKNVRQTAGQIAAEVAKRLQESK